MLPGLFLSLAIAIVAFALGRLVPLVGAPVFGIVLGMVVASVRKPGAVFIPGVKFASKQLLQFSIVVLGVNLSLSQILRSGWHSLPVMLGTLVITLCAAYFVGRLLGIERDLRRLIGVGTAICGGSAIAALSTVIEASEADIAYAISTVFLFNVVAVLVFPPLGHLLKLSQEAFGLWAGTAINDTSSVVAAGFAYGHAAGTEAVIVKLTRTTLIVPIVLFYAGKRIWLQRGTRGVVDWNAVVPWFILWFIAAALLNTFGIVPAAWHPWLTNLALFSIVVALTGVGLSTDFMRMRACGLRPLTLGLILWVLIAVSSLAIARLIGL
ncbi:MAG: YeiH family protein [Vulcanimicrobiaceae bacterium]